MQSGKNRCLRIQRQQKKAHERNQDLNSVLVADNYLAQLRLRTGSEESLRSMAMLDHMVGREPIEEVDCEQMAHAQTQELCGSLKEDRCEIKSNAMKTKASMLELTKKTLLKLRELNLKKSMHQTGRGGTEKRRKLNAEMEVYREMIPWAKGDEFKQIMPELTKALENSNEANFDKLIEQGFDAQMRANRELMASKFKNFQHGKDCLLETEVCKEPDLTEILKDAPYPDLSNLPHKEHFEFLRCLETQAIESDSNDELAGHIALNVGLTVASLAFPPLGVTRLAHIGVMASRAGGLARLAGAGVLNGVDRLYALDAFMDAYGSCKADHREVKFHQPLPTGAQVQCEQEKSHLAASLNFAPSNCMQEIIFASVDLIPFAAFASRQGLEVAIKGYRAKRATPAGRTYFSEADININRLRKDNNRLKEATRLGIVTTDNPQSAGAVLRSHNHFGPKGGMDPELYKFGTEARKMWLSEQLGYKGAALKHYLTQYTPAELNEKARILRKAGLSPKQIQDCLASGICGESFLKLDFAPETLRSLSFPARNSNHPIAEQALQRIKFRKETTLEGYDRLRVGVKEQLEVKRRLKKYYEEIGDMENARKVEDLMSKRDVPNIYVEYEVIDDHIYVGMLRNGKPDLAVPGAGNYLLRKLAEENPGKAIASTMGYDNAAGFKKGFRELLRSGEGKVESDDVLEMLRKIPTVRSFPGEVRFKPKFDANGDIEEMVVLRMPNFDSDQTVISGVDELMQNTQFQDWLRSLEGRADTYFESNPLFNKIP